MFITKPFQGSVADAVEYVNTLRVASAHLFQIATPLPSLCILIFKVPAREDRIVIRQELALSYKSD